MLSFVFFDDTFRRERSAIYVETLKRRTQEREKKENQLKGLLKQQRNGSRASVINGDTKVAGGIQNEEKPHPKLEDAGASKRVLESSASSAIDAVSVHSAPAHDPGAKRVAPLAAEAELKEIRLSLRDVNPIRPMIDAIRRLNNIAILTASGAFSSQAGLLRYPHPGQVLFMGLVTP